MIRATLRPYQTDAVEWMLMRERSKDAPGGCVFLECGLGKTVVTIATILANPKKNTLIIVPKSIFTQWTVEFEKFSDIVPMSVDSKTAKTISHDDIARAPVILTTYSSFSRIDDANESALLHYPFDRIVLDESHYIKNKKSKTHRVIRYMHSTIKWNLTGTPITKYADDFKNMLEFLGIFNVPLSLAAKRYVFRRTKEDVADDITDISDLDVEIVSVPFDTTRERDVHDDIVEEGKILYKAHKATGDGGMAILTQLLRLRQCVTNLNILTDTCEEFKDIVFDEMPTKLRMLRDIITNDSNKKTIVFCQFHYEMNAVENLIRSMGHATVRLDGSKTNAERSQSVDAFNNGDTNYFVIQIDAGGLGLNLTSASRVIINSLHWNATQEEQSIGRAWRIGNPNDIEVKRLVVSDSIDDHIMRVQQKKLDCAADILGDSRIRNNLKSKNAVSIIAARIFG